MIGTGTVGAFPAANATVHGRVVDTAATASTPSLSWPGTDPKALAAEQAGLPADQATFEQGPAEFTTALPDQRAQVAIRTAMAQLGLPYVWGGDGPTHGEAGFDCSGLTTFSYAAAGVSLPRTAHTQYYAGPHVPQGAALQPGDLVFYGTPATVHHVGMYLGDGKMVNAPTFGKPVRTAFYRWTGDDFLGATRPAATGPTTSGLLPYAPAAPSTGAPDDFPAPPAPAPTTTPQATAPQPAETVSAAEASAAAGAAPTTTETTPTTAAPATTTSSTTTVATTISGPSSTTTATTPTEAGETTTTPSTSRTTTTASPPTTTSPPSAASTTTSPPAPSSPPSPSSSLASSPTSPTSAPRDVTLAVTLPGGTGSLPTVSASGGVPVAVGAATVRGTTVLRVPAGVLGATAADSRITVAGTTHTVTSIATAATAEVDDLVAAVPAGAVVVLAAAGTSEWTVVTAI
jgi:cell wall-associated NlpC family hydrolase